jgi:hypothetical protein
MDPRSRGSDLILNLVYNPIGACLPPTQSSIEADFKRDMMSRDAASVAGRALASVAARHL